jgi:hypothetical protein
VAKYLLIFGSIVPYGMMGKSVKPGFIRLLFLCSPNSGLTGVKNNQSGWWVQTFVDFP